MNIFKLSTTPAGKASVDRLEKCVTKIKATYTHDALSENDIDTLMGVETKCSAYITLIQGSSADTQEKLTKFDEILLDVGHFCDVVEIELKKAQIEGSVA